MDSPVSHAAPRSFFFCGYMSKRQKKRKKKERKEKKRKKDYLKYQF